MKFKPDGRGSVAVELGRQQKTVTSMALSADAVAVPVFNLKKILVAVDFSELSLKAANYAAAFAKLFGAQLTLLHVIEPYPLVPQMDPVEIDSIVYAKQNLEKLKADICSSIQCQSALRIGEPHREIIDAAQELGIDLIILGTHGRAGLTRVLLGGTAERVVRHAGSPVLVVREREHDFVTSNAFATSNSSERED